jgi:chemotaxis response regulator CheB
VIVLDLGDAAESPHQSREERRPLHRREETTVRSSRGTGRASTFRSVTEAAGLNDIGVIMTGMGADGAAGLLEMKRAWAVSLAPDEATCVVFGMPKEATKARRRRVLPLPTIPMAILERTARGRL